MILLWFKHLIIKNAIVKEEECNYSCMPMYVNKVK